MDRPDIRKKYDGWMIGQIPIFINKDSQMGRVHLKILDGRADGWIGGQTYTQTNDRNKDMSLTLGAVFVYDSPD